MRRNKGSAMVELVCGASLFMVLLGLFVSMAAHTLNRLKAVETARLAAELEALPRALISDKAAILSRWRERLPVGSEVQAGAFKETPASHFYDLVQGRVQVPTRRGEIQERVVIHREMD